MVTILPIEKDKYNRISVINIYQIRKKKKKKKEMKYQVKLD